MTKRDDLLALAERVEAAAGPSRETDMRIKAAVYGAVAFVSPFNGEWCLYRVGTAEPRGGKSFERPLSVPHDIWLSDRYTASLDAAMTLVPEGATFMVDEGPAEWIVRGKRPKRGRARIYVLRKGWEDDGLRACDEEIGFGATPALALTAAALRALASQMED